MTHFIILEIQNILDAFYFFIFPTWRFSYKISCVRIRCDRFIRIIKDQQLYENFMHTKGRRSPTYKNLVPTKYNGFIVRTCLSELNQGHVSAFSPH